MTTATVQDIGYAFLKTYYQRMHTDPSKLFHLYSSTAELTHVNYQGGLSPTADILPTVKVIGKENISKFYSRNNKVVQDVRVKIDACDFQSTGAGNNGILILALGEICWSNTPTYRFCQTFVLTPVGNNNKMYDVTNDIMRFIPDVIREELLGAAFSQGADKKVASKAAASEEVSMKGAVSKEASEEAAPKELTAKEPLTEATAKELASKDVAGKEAAAKDIAVKETAGKDSVNHAKDFAREVVREHQGKDQSHREQAKASRETANREAAKENVGKPTVTATEEDGKKDRRREHRRDEKKEDFKEARKEHGADKKEVFDSGKAHKEEQLPEREPTKSAVADSSSSDISREHSKPKDDIKPDEKKHTTHSEHEVPKKMSWASQLTNSDSKAVPNVVTNYTRVPPEHTRTPDRKTPSPNGNGPKAGNKKLKHVSVPNKDGYYPIYIRNTGGVTNKDLTDALEREFGVVKKISASESFAVVDFEDPQCQQDAIRMHTLKINNQTVFMEPKTEKKRGPIASLSSTSPTLANGNRSNKKHSNRRKD
ncbi:ABR118Cp [Eremothecium gossypii ATCC 10895]|uniref:ABR118Cp n=1 Tax=Eremothecium gossypii (strain ATCC 10895 / CBS 109.51 / FGSC 9923 / NRRL Y-1056) TaxID=284811 RepID=Q75DA6_EREGS|nr:ABR118Cp [Eremothecium gossypii ATCC 10895]AAS50889.2 ABR118Cp [Eremothecium gossypii ATCC 10895]